MGPESRTRSPGRTDRGEQLDARNRPADAGGGDVHAVGLAVLHNFRVAARDDDTRGARGRSAMARTSASRTSVGRPASRT